MKKEMKAYLLKQENKEYWTSLLGEAVMDRVLEAMEPCRGTLYSKAVKEEKETLDVILDKMWWSKYRSVDVKVLETITFANFYRPFVGYGTRLLAEKIEDLNQWFAPSVYEDFQKCCVNQLQKICLRTLMAHMREAKLAGRILGDGPADEYRDYHMRVLQDVQTCVELLQRYPELARCVLEAVSNSVDFFSEVIMRYAKDYNILQETFDLCSIERITRMEAGLGDGHHRGRQVLRIVTESEKNILYKPHTMENEKAYDALLFWLEEHTGVLQRHMKIVSRNTYGWCEVITDKSCDSVQELERYYERFGVQIFLTWVLGTKDLHCENLIAAGEYPVIVDMEVLLSAKVCREDTIENVLLSEISEGVYYSGLLPYYHWNASGKGIDGSAVNGQGGQTYPFQVPVIVDDKTSDMRVEYQYPQMPAAKNLATLNGMFISPAKFEMAMVSGLKKAFAAVEREKKSFLTCCKILRHVRVRCLTADTQRYAMLLNSSYHPELMTSAVKRELFLYAIWTGRLKELAEVISYEVQCMLRGDIPLFYCWSDELSVFGEGIQRKDAYFTKSAYQMVINRVQNLDRKRLRILCDGAAMSLQMINDGECRYQNHIYHVNDASTENNMDMNKIYDEKITDLLERLLQYCVWNEAKDEVSWYTVSWSHGQEATWSLAPMGKYLYDGLAGMLLIFENVKQNSDDERVVHCASALRRMLFAYTDKAKADNSVLDSKKTGMYDGEGSIVYVYLLLYHLTKEEIYLSYAMKHGELLIELLAGDTSYDLLAGNAGAAQVLLWLYTISQEPMYLMAAKKAVAVFWKSRVQMQEGVGWQAEKNTLPMSGMAHGNAGILMPVIWLWNLTGESKYEEMAEEIWQYEEYLFEESIGNWADMRMKDIPADSIGSVAWCHGAPGILLSRMICYGLVEEDKWRKRFLTDMDRAYKKLKDYWRRDSWSLCHGNTGNLWILELAERFFARRVILTDKGEILVDEKKFVAKEMKRRLMKMSINYLPQELLNPGLMSGYGGILLYLLWSEQ